MSSLVPGIITPASLVSRAITWNRPAYPILHVHEWQPFAFQTARLQNPREGVPLACFKSVSRRLMYENEQQMSNFNSMLLDSVLSTASVVDPDPEIHDKADLDSNPV